MQVVFDEFVISDDKERLDLNTIKGFLHRSYWADQRTDEQIEESIRHSVCYGIYHGSKQVGFARVITDYATMYWLCDVFIDENYRGRGLGKKLIESLTTSEELKNLSGMLATRDAHELYRQYGFEDGHQFMRRASDYVSKFGRINEE